MDGMLLPIIGTIIGIAIGFLIAKFLERGKASQMLNRAKKDSAKILREAKANANTILKEAKIEGEGIKKDKMLQAKERFIELKANHEKHVQKR